MKVAFLIPNLSSGGAERVASTLCNQWVEAGHQVDLITWEQENSPSHYPLNEAINLHHLALDQQTTSIFSFVGKNVRRLIRLRRELRDISPDLVISFLIEANVVCALAARSLRLPSIVCERIHPDAPIVSKSQRILRRFTYPLASHLSVQTEEIANWYQQNLQLKTTVIPNPIELSGYSVRGIEQRGDKETYKIVAIGRLEHQKGFDRLIAAFAPLSCEFPNWEVNIYGRGSLRIDLEEQIRKFNLSDKIHLMGTSNQIPSILAQADLMVHPARFEGFPNVIIEALASGCCVVATDCPGGTRQLLQDGAFGLLCTEETLQDSLKKALSDLALRKAFEEKATQAVQHLDASAIARKWIELAERVIQSQK